MKHTITVKGMHCKSCKMLVQDAIEERGGKLVSMEVNEKTQTGKIVAEYAGDKKELLKAIEAEGDYTAR